MNRRLLLLVLLVLGAGSLVLLLLRVTLANGLPAQIAANYPLVSGHPEIVRSAARSAVRTSSASGDALPQGLVARLRETARELPLAEEPFLVFAVEALRNGDRARAIRLLEEVRARNPRQRFGRLMLLEQYVHRGDVEQAAQELITLARLMPDASETFLAQFASLAIDARARAAMKQALASEPMLDSVLDHLAMNKADPDIILDLAEVRAPSAAKGPRWQTLLVDNLVERGEFERAYREWRSFTGLSNDGNRSLVYDAGFQGLPGTPPFNWSLSSGEVGAVGWGQGQAMEVDYFGRTSGILAQQLILLEPGSYRISMQAEGDGAKDGGLVWSIACRPGNIVLVSLALDDIAYTPRRYSSTFVVPPSRCGAQLLQLNGVAAEFAATHTVRITDFSIKRSGGRI